MSYLITTYLYMTKYHDGVVMKSSVKRYYSTLARKGSLAKGWKHSCQEGDMEWITISRTVMVLGSKCKMDDIALCPFCKHVVSSTVLKDALIQDMSVSECSYPLVSIICPDCHTMFDHLPKETFGNPRNIALIGHWDLWQPFSTTCNHSCGLSCSY